jgi:putative transposase
MAKHPKPEEIVAKLRQADVLISQGQSVADTIRALGVSSVMDDRWRPEVGSGSTDEGS